MTDPSREHALLLLIDHDNVPFGAVSVQQVIDRWLATLSSRLPDLRVLNLDARAYGGWWVGDAASEGRYRAVEYYQAAFPSVMQFGDRFVRLRFSFADYLITDSGGVRITDTVVTRASPQYARLRSAATPCTESGCQLQSVRNWVKRRKACTKPGCPHPFEAHFERREQKQVDVHLATDLLAIASSPVPARHIAVLSDDADFLPAALRTASTLSHSLSTLSLLRVVPRTTYADATLAVLGAKIIDCR